MKLILFDMNYAYCVISHKKLWMLTNIANARNMSMKTMLPSYYTDAELIDVTNGR